MGRGKSAASEAMPHRIDSNVISLIKPGHISAGLLGETEQA